ncbi:integrase core domain-containing protein, partial [Clostridium amazonitimonense]|uniref:integrase core domain-containing protein n=1 Tax=Clostridium amazonitimonense TaxID=1499689 RepID=UPI0005093C62
MSRKNNCWVNAPIEWFWSKLGCELLHVKHFKTCAEARMAIIKYIELFYNYKRLHSTLGYR